MVILIQLTGRSTRCFRLETENDSDLKQVLGLHNKFKGYNMTPEQTAFYEQLHTRLIRDCIEVGDEGAIQLLTEKYVVITGRKS